MKCQTCRIEIKGNKGSMTNHLRVHVREGILVEKLPGEFAPTGVNYWGYVIRSDPQQITIATLPGNPAPSSVTVERFKVGGPTKPGDAVRLEYRTNKGTRQFGMWFAEPLGYEAVWIKLPDRSLA